MLFYGYNLKSTIDVLINVEYCKYFSIFFMERVVYIDSFKKMIEMILEKVRVY